MRRHSRSSAARAPTRPLSCQPAARAAALSAPALAPLSPAISSQGSSSRRSSTPQVKAPCAPPPCRARDRGWAVLLPARAAPPRRRSTAGRSRATLLVPKISATMLPPDAVWGISLGRPVLDGRAPAPGRAAALTDSFLNKAGEQGLKHRVRSIFGARQPLRQHAAFLPQGRNYKRHTDVVEKLP